MELVGKSLGNYFSSVYSFIVSENEIIKQFAINMPNYFNRTGLNLPRFKIYQLVKHLHYMN